MLEVRLNYPSVLSIEGIRDRYHMQRHSKSMQPKNVEKVLRDVSGS